MLLAMISVVGLTALIAIAIVGHRDGALVGSRSTRLGVASSPVDQAQRILARRYSKREITAEEYDRMMEILRR